MRRLTEACRHALAENARDDIGWTSGGKRHNDRDWTRWETLCAASGGGNDGNRRYCDKEENGSDKAFHALSSFFNHS
jgi:hypothetical protein